MNEEPCAHNQRAHQRSASMATWPTLISHVSNPGSNQEMLKDDMPIDRRGQRKDIAVAGQRVMLHRQRQREDDAWSAPVCGDLDALGRRNFARDQALLTPRGPKAWLGIVRILR